MNSDAQSHYTIRIPCPPAAGRGNFATYRIHRKEAIREREGLWLFCQRAGQLVALEVAKETYETQRLLPSNGY